MLPVDNGPAPNSSKPTIMSHQLVPTSGYCAPQDVHFIPSTSSQQQENQQYHRKPYTPRVSSGSADELEEGTVKVNDWQIVKNNKRRRINRSKVDISRTDVTLSNRFDPLPSYNNQGKNENL
jgi:hypothetical protein